MSDNKVVMHLKAGRFRVPVQIEKKDSKLYLAFGYNPALLAEVKNMEGARWHGFDTVPLKQWSINDSHRNWFQLHYLQYAAADAKDKPNLPNPYATYDLPLLDVTQSSGHHIFQG